MEFQLDFLLEKKEIMGIMKREGSTIWLFLDSLLDVEQPGVVRL